MRAATRLVALAFLCTGLASLWMLLEPVVPRNAPQAEEVAVAAPARPASAPRAIPGWAWELRAWERTEPAVRPPRPAAAPRTLPAWYEEWREWREAVTAR